MVLHTSTMLKLSVRFFNNVQNWSNISFLFWYSFSGFSVIASVDSFYKMFDRVAQGFDKIWDTTFLHRLFKEFHLFYVIGDLVFQTYRHPFCLKF